MDFDGQLTNAVCWLCNSVHSITDLVFKNALSADMGVGLNASVLPCWQHNYLDSSFQCAAGWQTI